MKKLIALIALAAGLFSVNSYANSVSCYVDTMRYDNYTQNQCWGAESNPRFFPKVAFKVNATKEVARVEWKFSGIYDPSSASKCTGKVCVVDVYKIEEGYMTACVDKIYYKDYTWADVNWCADAEYMYSRSGVWN